jgi:hypothetical protein
VNDIDEVDLKRLTDHYPIGADMTLQVLKGHLILEETLRELLDALLTTPSALKGEKGASFSCHHVICLVHAMAPPPVNGVAWVWASAKQLNNIRNELAHKLSPAGLDSKVQTFVETVRKSDPAVTSHFGEHSSRDKEFAMSVSTLCGLFSRM